MKRPLEATRVATPAGVRRDAARLMSPRPNGTIDFPAIQLPHCQRKPPFKFQILQISTILCKMARGLNQFDAALLGASIRQRRSEEGLTLLAMAGQVRVDASQISRIERGNFTTHSRNLQIICTFLQIDLEKATPKSLGERVEVFASQSDRNRSVAEAIVSALEELAHPEKR
ncbi:MAG: multiprotein-bridging factor 1 family protein [Massilia sp.]